MVDAADLKNAARERAGLVENDGLCLCQSLQIVRAFYQNALAARAAQTCEEAQRNADHQRAGAAYDEEGQRAIDPVGPVAAQTHEHDAHKRRQYRKRKRRVAHDGGVDPCKARDKLLRARLARAGAFNKLQYLRHCRFAEGLCRAHADKAAEIYAAAYDLVALGNVARQALAGQGAGVYGRAAGDDNAVDRHLFARLHDYDAAGLDLVGIDLLELSGNLDIRVVRADVHQRGYAAAAFADGVALEQLADLVKQHYQHRLVEVAAAAYDRKRDRADRGNGHQEVLVENAAV